MNNFKQLMLAMFLALLSYATASAENYILYTSSDGNIIKPREEDYYGNLVFGAKIVFNTYENGQGKIEFDGEVTSIGEAAFSYCTRLTSIEIPNSVAEIGDFAFDGCKSLKAVYITDLAAWCKIKYGYYMSSPLNYAHNLYLNSELITNLVIPNSVTSIGDYAFLNCTSLTSVVIPNSVTSIGYSAFAGCKSLPVENNLRYADTYLVGAVDKNQSTYTIKEGTKWIGSNAFEECKSLTTVEIPNSVTAIGSSAFRICSSLTAVEIPNSVTEIGVQAFWYCTSMTSIEIPSSVTEIGLMAFGGCDSMTAVYITDLAAWCNIKFEDYLSNPLNCAHNLYLNSELITNLVIPNSVTSIGDYAFLNCSNLTSVEIPSSVTEIGVQAFYCTSMTSIEIPSSVTEIGKYAFSSCYRLPIENNLRYADTYLVEAIDWKQSTYIIKEGTKWVGTGAFKNRSGLTSVEIPNSVTEIGEEAFYGCKSLTSVTCYAENPPRIESYAFYEISSDAVLYVPTIASYFDSDWNKYFKEILPVSIIESHSINVNLPEDWQDGKYKDMTLELAEKDSEQQYKIVVSDKGTYSFSGLTKNSIYSLAMKNSWGDVLGEIETIEVGDENVIVSFESLRQPKTVSLNVLANYGEDVTENVAVSWMKADGSLMKQGASIAGVLEGSEIGYQVTLPDEMLAEYSSPAKQTYTVKADGNNISYTLAELGKVTFSGNILDSNGRALPYAVLTISPLVNGKYGTSVTATTDVAGHYEVELPNLPLKVTVSANGYLSQTVELTSAADGLGQISLERINGLSINITTDYADNANVAYRALNLQGAEIEGCIYQGSSIVLPATIGVGDELTVVAYSKSNKFKDVSKTVVLDGRNTYVEIPIVEYGSISAKCEGDGYGSIAILYNNVGELAAKAQFTEGVATFSTVPDGQYSVVAMKKSSVLNSVLNLSALSTMGLSEGNDYLLVSASTTSGAVSEVALGTIPELDEAKLYFATGEGTYFMPGKAELTIGNYQVLKARVELKDEYAGKVKDAVLVVDIPSSCEFVMGSVLSGKNTGFEINGNRITIPMENIDDLVRFCVIPLESGETRPTAFVQATIDGSNVLLPIGSAYFEAKNFSLATVEKTSKTTIALRGAAMPNSEVLIYDNETLVGKTNALANGQWTANVTFAKPYSHSFHEIYGEVLTTDGKRLLTETKLVEYDKNYIDVEKVTMLYGNYKIEFDPVNGKTNGGYYSYVPGQADFTFTANFTNDDPSLISNLTFKVLASDGTTRTLDGKFNETTNQWVANSQYDDTHKLPINVKVEYVCNIESQIDAEQFDGALKAYENDRRDFHSEMSRIDGLLQKLSDEWEKDNPDEELVAEYKNLLYKEIGIEETSGGTVYDEANIQELIDECDALLNSDESFKEENIFTQTYADLSEFMEGVTISTCENLIPQALISEGYEIFTKSDGTTVYILTSEDKMKVADFANNIYYEIDLTNEKNILAKAIRKADDNNGDFISIMVNYREEIIKASNRFIALMSSFADTVDDIKNRLVHLLSKKISPELLNLDNSIKYLEKNKGSKILIFNLRLRYTALCKKAILCDKIVSWIDKNISTKGLRIGKIGGGAFAAFNIFTVSMDASENINNIMGVYAKIPEPCKNDQEKATSLRKAVITMGINTGVFYIAQYLSSVVQLTAAVFGIEAAIPTGGASLSAVGVSIGLAVVSFVASENYDAKLKRNLGILGKQIKNLKCKDNKDEDKDEEKNSGNGNTGGNRNTGGNEDYSTPPVSPSIDPSGYVYEAVPSNRLQGVTATVYYMQQTEDMYGDVTEEPVLWNASEFGQQNPLTTDEQGMYAWDVPQGMWQVKFEKEGYETTYSEWLPVPPPQLDVNISMVQAKQPEVKNLHAYTDGITIEFDKFMLPETLTKENIKVSQNGKDVEGTVTLLNQETDKKGNTYCSKIEFVPNAELAEGEATVSVSKSVKSYASVMMGEDFQKTVKVEARIKDISVDENVKVYSGSIVRIEGSVVPLSAGAGKKLVVEDMNPYIAAIDQSSVAIDANGNISFEVKGLIPGNAVVRLSLEGYDFHKDVMVNVLERNQVAYPVASLPSGSFVDKGTEIRLSCQTEGATIYYTTDGSCPCDLATAKVYDGTPIVINESVTIKAIAMKQDMEDSRIMEFVYTVRENTGVETVTANSELRIYPLPMRDVINISVGGQTIRKVTVCAMNGTVARSVESAGAEVQVDVLSLPAGIYIVNVTTADGTLHRKVVKVE